MAKSDEAPKGVSMLDKLAGQIVDTKGEKGAKLSPALTPVAGEVRLPTTTAMFPNDVPQEVVEGIIRSLERQYVHLGEVIDALRLTIGLLPTDIPAPEDPVKEAERAADKAAEKRAAVVAAMAGETPGGEETFDERFKRLQTETQAAAFTPAIEAAAAAAEAGGGPVEVMAAAMAASADGWSCPEHGTTNVVVKTSPRRGVEFRKCVAEGCRELEKV